LNNSLYYKKVKRADKQARFFISFGGYSVIVSILAILFFLVVQSLPLSKGASIKKRLGWLIDSPAQRILLTGADQYQELCYTLDSQGRIVFYSLKNAKQVDSASIPLDQGESILCAAKGSLSREFFSVGTSQGRFVSGEIRMSPRFEGSVRKIVPSVRLDDPIPAGSSEAEPPRIVRMAYCKNEDAQQSWAWQTDAGSSRAMFYDPDADEVHSCRLDSFTGPEKITALALDFDGTKLIAGTDRGELFWFDISNTENVFLKDNWKAYDAPITALSFLVGNNALVICSHLGQLETWYPVRGEDQSHKFAMVNRFESHPAPVGSIYPSSRNRGFLTIDVRGNIQLNYSTTGRTQVKFKSNGRPIQAAAIAPKSDGIVLIDAGRHIGHYSLSDPHPETTLKTLLGKVWYEGYDKPEFVWQSTGGSDKFEPKFSLIPLIFGTLKGTIYTLLFSIPLALLAAIYVSQFSPKWLAGIIKPTVEIMAALPSVVIGFLAGLYFAPLFERHLMLIFLVVTFLPIAFLISIGLWRFTPETFQTKLPRGWELLFVIPLIFLCILTASALAGPLESSLFHGHFQQWMFEKLHLQYDQRNSLVVGFALGFAVIPIIFTIAEDALSNVPESLTSASLALGASRWQTVRHIVLPAAAGGIFAAIMLGLGRAIGETMIVLMATGNTPILDLSPFNGFRAMSANIAVEIPEAPVGGTLYHVLFLTAFILFLFTFVINSVAAFIGDRLRKKYARF
jgi:phosphate transport system permease protein